MATTVEGGGAERERAGLRELILQRCRGALPVHPTKRVEETVKRRTGAPGAWGSDDRFHHTPRTLQGKS